MENMIVLYGIKNCDTVRKARAFLDAHDTSYRFHDFRQDGIDTETILSWCHINSWEALLNKGGTTWRKLSKSEQESVCDAQSAAELMTQNPTLIKRPILAAGDTVIVGFNPEIYQQIGEL